MHVSVSSPFPGLIDVPAFDTLSSLRISARESVATGFRGTDFLVHAESDDGFQRYYNTHQWPTGVRPARSYGQHKPDLRSCRGTKTRYGRRKQDGLASAALRARGGSGDWCSPRQSLTPRFLERPQRSWTAATLHFETVEGMKPVVAESVRKFVRARPAPCSSVTVVGPVVLVCSCGQFMMRRCNTPGGTAEHAVDSSSD